MYTYAIMHLTKYRKKVVDVTEKNKIEDNKRREGRDGACVRA